MKQFIKRLILSATLALSACAMHKTPSATTPALPVNAAFEKLQTLKGDWRSDKDAKGHTESDRYQVTSGGSAITETLFPGTDHEMVSVFFMADGALRMTHYCMLANQPTLQLSRMDGDTMVFSYLSGGNINSAVDRHMHELHLTILNPNQIKEEWTGYDKGKPADTKVINLKRVKTKKA